MAKVKEEKGGTLGDRRRRKEERNKEWKTTFKMDCGILGLLET